MIPRVALVRALRQIRPTKRAIRTPIRSRLLTTTNTRCASHAPSEVPPLLESQSPTDAANEKMDELTEMYMTAVDEFEIAREETERASIYAEADRKAAQEELTKVQEAYKAAVEGTDQYVADEVQRRIGQRLKQLEKSVAALEEMALNHD